MEHLGVLETLLNVSRIELEFGSVGFLTELVL